MTQTKEKQKGFTLVEMLVVLGIFVIITTIVLAKNSEFDNTIILGTLAYDVALSIRESQAFGLGVRGASSADFDSPYGVRFDTDFPDTYWLGVDSDDNGQIEGGEYIKTFTLNKGFSIGDICGSVNTIGDCDDTTQVVNIIFSRPDPDAYIKLGNGTEWVYTEIVISSPDGTERRISVTSAGQISVQTP